MNIAEEVRKQQELAEYHRKGMYKIAACNPMSRGVLDEVMCTNDARTMLLLDDLAEGFKQFQSEGLGVQEIIVPEKDFRHLQKNTNVVQPPFTPGEKEGTILGARVSFGDRTTMSSENFEKIKGRYPLRRVRNGYLIKSEQIPGLKDKWQIKTYLLHPVFERKPFWHGLDIIVKSRTRPLNGISDQEWKAIDTLREMITESEYRKYIKYGFLLVRGISGRIYQVFRENQHTKVWKDGKLIEEICVRIADRGIPETDSVIALKIMIETNEDEARKMANVYPMKKAA